MLLPGEPKEWTPWVTLACTKAVTSEGYMLAQIAEETHAPDRAAQSMAKGGDGDHQDLGQKSMMRTRLTAEDPSNSRTGVRVPEVLMR